MVSNFTYFSNQQVTQTPSLIDSKLDVILSDQAHLAILVKIRLTSDIAICYAPYELTLQCSDIVHAL